MLKRSDNSIDERVRIVMNRLSELIERELKLRVRGISAIMQI